jgi:hypothetical protein
MRVLVCGSRTWDDPTAMYMVLDGYSQRGSRITTLIHGKAKGADLMADAWALGEEDIEIVPFPADWEKFGKRAGFVRNKRMLDEGKPNLVLAFVDKPLAESRGTAMMVDLARQAGVPTYVIQKIV